MKGPTHREPFRPVRVDSLAQGVGEQSLYLAKLAEQAERFDDMVVHITAVAKSGEVLNVEERNLLSVAFKQKIGLRRASWRILTSIHSKEEEKGNAERSSIVTEYRTMVEKELRELVSEIQALLDETLIPTAEDADAKVFYFKMKGDYFRYLAEFVTGDEKAEAGKNANEGYSKAWEVASESLKTTDPVRLGLALNYSVFYYEILGETEKACSLAKQAFDDALHELDSLTEDSYEDSTFIVQLLRDNLALWNSPDDDDEEEDSNEDEDEEADDN